MRQTGGRFINNQADLLDPPGEFQSLCGDYCGGLLWIAVCRIDADWRIDWSWRWGRNATRAIASRTGRRMDLLIAGAQGAGVTDIGPDTQDGVGRQASRRTWAIDTNRLDERAAIGAQGRAEGIYINTHLGREAQAIRIGLLGDGDAGVPCLEDIDVGRIDRAARLEAARLAAIFNVDTDNRVVGRLLLAIDCIGRRKAGDTGPDEGIVRSRTRHGPADAMIIRVAKDELPTSECRRPAVRTLLGVDAAAAQAFAEQGVEDWVRGGIVAGRMKV